MFIKLRMLMGERNKRRCKHQQADDPVTCRIAQNRRATTIALCPRGS
jgi:hypothetical protein